MGSVVFPCRSSEIGPEMYTLKVLSSKTNTPSLLPYPQYRNVNFNVKVHSHIYVWIRKLSDFSKFRKYVKSCKNRVCVRQKTPQSAHKYEMVRFGTPYRKLKSGRREFAQS
jgi:hypothetical protein